jgi:hypothetical protein
LGRKITTFFKNNKQKRPFLENATKAGKKQWKIIFKKSIVISKIFHTFAVAMLKLTSHIAKEILPDNSKIFGSLTYFLKHTH